MNGPRSARHQTLLSDADAVLASGSSGLISLPPEVDLVARRGRGVHLEDVDGREYVDFFLGYGPLILGHAHPAVVEAVRQRAADGSHFYLLTEETIALARLLTDLRSGPSQVRFVGTGSEATFYALRLARSYSKRSKVMLFEGAFHGTHDYAFPRHNGVPASIRAEVVLAPYNDLEATSRLIAEHAGQLAAVITESPQRCVPPEPGFLSGLRSATREHGVVLIADEVITGFRLDYGGAQQRYGFEADLACYGKVLGGGYPLAAIVGRREIMELADTRQPRSPGLTLVGGTLSSNPLSAAAGLATLRTLQAEDPYARIRTLGRRLREGLDEIAVRRGLPLRTIGDDTVFAPLFAEREPTNGRELALADHERTSRLCTEIVRRGVLIYKTVFMSAAHTEAAVDRAIEAADQAAATM